VTPVVRTSSGALRGEPCAHGTAFLGVPYAAPPVGALRLLPPEPAQAWDGVRDAVAFGPPAPQPVRELPGVDFAPLFGERWTGQDTELTLNVWTPDPGGSGLPVIVFLHGGAFVAGSTTAPMYSGDAFARDGVVAVSVVYRLGLEGFLSPEGGVGNLGLHDQLAALRWVQQEIGAFGGDAGNVTVCGQSAGAMSLDLLLGSPRSRGLLRRAISQSGGVSLTLSPEQGARVARAYSEQLGVPPTREGFAGVTLARTIAGQAELPPASVDLTTAEDTDPSAGMLLLLPVRDGDVVADDPLAAVGGEVDLLIGDTLEEGNLYLVGMPGFDQVPEQAARDLAARNHPDPDALIAAYRAARPQASGGELMAQILTDAMFRIPSGQLAEAHARAGGRTWVYEFAWRSGALGGRLGACHAIDLPFTFDTLSAPGLVGEEQMLGPAGGPQELATRTHQAWVRFARDGDPGWTRFDVERRASMRIDETWQELGDPGAAMRRAWGV
jgi:para-nitrobenzyl esterase